MSWRRPYMRGCSDAALPRAGVDAVKPWTKISSALRKRPGSPWAHLARRLSGISNSVHGPGYDMSFVHAYFTKRRGMLHDGGVDIISDESESKYWRIYGLLNLILDVEIKLRVMVKQQIYNKTTTMAWSGETSGIGSSTTPRRSPCQHHRRSMTTGRPMTPRSCSTLTSSSAIQGEPHVLVLGMLGVLGMSCV